VSTGRSVRLQCLRCGHFSVLTAHMLSHLAISPNTPIAAFVKRLRCRKCGNQSVLATRNPRRKEPKTISSAASFQLLSERALRRYKNITGELAPTRYVPSAAIFAGNQDHIGAMGASPDSGFDIQSDLLLAILASSRAVHERSVISIEPKSRKAIKTKMLTRPGDKIGDAA
jgi:ribosomal protein S27AE